MTCKLFALANHEGFLISNQHILKADLSSKVALITGASRGIGAYYAEVLANNGAFVIVGGRSMESLDRTIQRISKIGGKALPLILEMTDFKSFDEKVEEIILKCGSIDILVNNAAVAEDKEIFEVSPSDWDFHMDINLKGVFFLSQSVAKQMKAQKNGGSIINIAAIDGDHVRKNCACFSVSKAGVIHLTKLMTYELISYKIRVNALSIGLFPSESVKEWIETDPKSQDYLSRIPIKRAGQLNDLEGPILLLASDASCYMAG